MVSLLWYTCIGTNLRQNCLPRYWNSSVGRASGLQSSGSWVGFLSWVNDFSGHVTLCIQDMKVTPSLKPSVCHVSAPPLLEDQPPAYNDIPPPYTSSPDQPLHAGPAHGDTSPEAQHMLPTEHEKVGCGGWVGYCWSSFLGEFT